MMEKSRFTKTCREYPVGARIQSKCFEYIPEQSPEMTVGSTGRARYSAV